MKAAAPPGTRLPPPPRPLWAYDPAGAHSRASFLTYRAPLLLNSQTVSLPDKLLSQNPLKLGDCLGPGKNIHFPRNI